jgi:hypothetical protein
LRPPKLSKLIRTGVQSKWGHSIYFIQTEVEQNYAQTLTEKRERERVRERENVYLRGRRKEIVR